MTTTLQRAEYRASQFKDYLERKHSQVSAWQLSEWRRGLRKANETIKHYKGREAQLHMRF